MKNKKECVETHRDFIVTIRFVDWTDFSLYYKKLIDLDEAVKTTIDLARKKFPNKLYDRIDISYQDPE